MKKNQYWYKIDNAGKIFPAISKDSRSNVFRQSFYLYESVDKDLLELAINKILPRFEAFAVQMKNGLFWNYLSENHRHFKVELETSILCKHFKPYKNNGYLFKVFYFDNKITLETFHAISDGAGALAFLKSILHEYFKFKGYKLDPEDKILSEKPYSKRESEDMFVKLYDPLKRKNLREETAYHFHGEQFSNNWSLLVKVKLDTKTFIKLIKTKYQATITQYICALLAYSIYKESPDFTTGKKPIKLFVPVNLRPYFDSITLRNFSLFIKSTYSSQKKDWTFDEMLKLTKFHFEQQLDKHKLHQRISSNVGFEKNILLRILPLFIKNIAFRIGYNMLGESINTTSLSNLGIVDIPSGYKPYVKDFDFVNGTRGLSVAIASIHDHINIIMNTSLKDLSIISHLTSMLVEEGLEVIIDTNYREGYDEIL
jgi:NRPS condensation-like uncharacterized protein